MAAKRSTARQFGGGGLDIGAILNATLGGGADVESVPDIPPESTITDKPYDWTGKDIPTGSKIQPKITQQDMSDISSGNLFRGKNKEGQDLAARANIENKLAEETAKRGIRTKQAEIPVDVQREQALTGPLIDRQKALHTLANDAELQKRLAIDPLDIEKERKQNIMAILTSKGIQPTEENIAKHDALIS